MPTRISLMRPMLPLSKVPISSALEGSARTFRRDSSTHLKEVITQSTCRRNIGSSTPK
uniref:Predicted protein n=1 Tax=Hordeum vulgare subsp. vulgare TaxID=112509 RepID=F2E2H1_HORVV|nr:predicted protein [Hordeum vulgare subsp. vulgare]